jgi:hypothetical protein
MILIKNHSQLLLDTVQSHHPFLINHRTVYIYRHFERDLYLFLNCYLRWFVDVNRFIHIDRLLYLNVDWLLYLNVDRLLNYLRGHPHLERNFPLHLNNLIHDPLWSWNIYRHLHSHLHRFLNHNLSHSELRYLPVFILEFFLQHQHFHHQLVLISL